jgi:hypothetical protein
MSVDRAAETNHARNRYCGGLRCEHSDAELEMEQSYNGCILCENARLQNLLKRFMACRLTAHGGWRISSGSEAGDSLSKVYTDVSALIVGPPDDPEPVKRYRMTFGEAWNGDMDIEAVEDPNGPWVPYGGK